MPVNIGGNQITGISTATSGTDAAYKQYTDNKINLTALPVIDDAYLFTDGSVSSYRQIKNSQEFTTPGITTFNVPLSASEFFMELTGAGGGGAAGFAGTSGGGGGGGAVGHWKIPKGAVLGTTFTINVGLGGTSGFPGTATTVSWTGPAGIHSITAPGGSAGLAFTGGSGGSISTDANYVLANTGTSGAIGTTRPPFIIARSTRGQNMIGTERMYQTTGGAGGAVSSSGLAILGGDSEFAGNISYGTTNLFFSNSFSENDNTGFSTTSSYFSYGSGGGGGNSMSTNAIYWKVRTNPGVFNGTSNYGSPIIYDNTNFVTGNTVSTDAINWTVRTVGFSVFSLAYAPGEPNPYIAGGFNGRLSVSTNTIVWTLRTAPSATSILSLAYASGQTYPYIAGTSGGTVIASTDTIVWEIRTNPGALPNNGTCNAVTWASGTPSYYIAAGFNEAGVKLVISVSTDSIVWTVRTIPIDSVLTGGICNRIYYAPGASQPYLACGKLTSLAAGGFLFASTDTIVWRARTTTFTTAEIYDVLYVSGTSSPYIIAGGELTTGKNQNIKLSTDTIVWNATTINVDRLNVSKIFYANNTYIQHGRDTVGYYKLSSQTTNYVVGGGNGGSGTRGGGGGGGGYDQTSNIAGLGGTGGNGYVRISWI